MTRNLVITCWSKFYVQTRSRHPALTSAFEAYSWLPGEYSTGRSSNGVRHSSLWCRSPYRDLAATARNGSVCVWTDSTNEWTEIGVDTMAWRVVVPDTSQIQPEIGIGTHIRLPPWSYIWGRVARFQNVFHSRRQMASSCLPRRLRPSQSSFFSRVPLEKTREWAK